MIIIKLILDTLNLSQKEFAAQLGVSRQTVFMWLSGYKISQKYISMISEYYNIPVSFIENSQISGFKLTSSDQDYLKKCILKNKSIYSGNVIYKLLKVITTRNYYESADLDKLLNLNLDFNNIEIYDGNIKLNEDDYYLIIFEKKFKSLRQIDDELHELIVNIDKTAYIIVESETDNISIIKFGGRDETNN